MVSRAERLAEEIKHVVAELLIRSAPDGCGNAMLTVSRVELTGDLGEARIYVSVFPRTTISATAALPQCGRTEEGYAWRSEITSACAMSRK
ncbi:MAG: ribosome-binding factor A [Candidatus Marinimicrobia bacterium]|nr:ribosome-binding factor A [Candidatus Neomarinimicrobiota bacterium]